MATESIASFDDLIGLLDRNPEYRSRLRRSILDEEFQRLPEHVTALTEQTRALGAVTTSLAERMDQLTERVDQLTVRMDQMAEQMRYHSDLFKDILSQLNSMGKRVDRLTGDEAERRFRERTPAYFGHLLRRIRVVDNGTLADQVDDAIESGSFAEADREPLLLLDVVARGRDVETREDRYLAAEVSSGIGETDILRAADRAALLEKLTGVPALPVVAGYSISSKFRSIAAERQVQVVIVSEPD